jgi:hypothetical protein
MVLVGHCQNHGQIWAIFDILAKTSETSIVNKLFIR